MYDVVFYETFKEEEEALRKYMPEQVHALYVTQTIQGAGHKKSPAKLISIRTQSYIPPSWANELSGILTRSQGYDHLVAYRREIKKEISCGYLGNYCARAMAEHAIMVMLMLLRKAKAQLRKFETFDRDHLTGGEAQNKKALVVGVGNIGSQIVDIVKALKMPVKGVDVVKRVKDLQYVSLESGVAWAEVIFCALPLTDKTEGLLDYQLLKKAKPGVTFINISRAETSPIKDIKKLLDEGVLGALSLDVYPEEGVLAGYMRGNTKNKTKTIDTILELKDKENVLFTPHNAFNTKESLELKVRLSAQSVVAFLKAGKFPTAVPRE